MASRLYKNKYRQDTLRLQNWDYANDGCYFVTICTKNRIDYFGEVINGKMYLNQIGKIIFYEWLNTKNKRFNVLLDKFIIMPNHIHGIIKINYRSIKTIFPEQSIAAAHCNAPLQRGVRLKHCGLQCNVENCFLEQPGNASHGNSTNGFFNQSGIASHGNENDVGRDEQCVAPHCNAALRQTFCDDKIFFYDTMDGNPNYNIKYKNEFGPQSNNLSAIIRGFKGATKKLIYKKFLQIDFMWQSGFYERIIRNQFELDRIRKYIANNPQEWSHDRNK